MSDNPYEKIERQSPTADDVIGWLISALQIAREELHRADEAGCLIYPGVINHIDAALEAATEPPPITMEDKDDE